MCGHQGPRHQGPPQLLEDQGRFGQAEADPTGRLGQAEVEHPGLTQLLPPLAIDHPLGHLEGAQMVEAELALAQPADARGQLVLELGQFEVHGGSPLSGGAGLSAVTGLAGPDGSLGRPRMRSPTMLRWI